MILSLLHLVGLRPRVYYTLTNFRPACPPPLNTPMLSIICAESIIHDYATCICQTVLELCNMRDEVSHCEYLNSDGIYILLSSICTDYI